MNNQIKKRCTMNCGKAFSDTRTYEQIKENCSDCHVLTERDHDIDGVNQLSLAMVRKLDKKRAEGRGGWQTASTETLSQMLINHVAKGDPVDVANFCMMLFMNGQSIVTERSAIPAIFAGVQEAIATWKDATPEAGASNIEAMIQRIAELEKEVTKYDNATSQAISERDDWEGLATDLAHEVGNHFRVDIGEHSSGNCPVKEAIAVLNEEYITDSDEDRRIKELESALKNTLYLVCNDAFAVSFQTFGQYRSALINCINQEFKAKNIELNPTFDLVEHLYRQRNFSVSTFGPGFSTAGVINHIRKELIEIENSPADVTEWIDVVLLAFDGAWRAGHSPEDIAQALFMKQQKNESRTWPDWRTTDPEAAIEHIKGDAA